MHSDRKRRGASGYLPSDTVIADDGSLRPAPPVVCFLGPFGKQTRLVMNIFESHKMCMFILLTIPAPSLMPAF